jgi:heterodisulfide reductase subunit A-like polyferredoxin
MHTLCKQILQPILRGPCRSLPRPRASVACAVKLLRTFHFSREARFDLAGIERESDEVDVCIVGGGPAGLSAAIRLKQLAEKDGREIRVLLLEKGSEIGNYRYCLKAVLIYV